MLKIFENVDDVATWFHRVLSMSAFQNSSDAFLSMSFLRLEVSVSKLARHSILRNNSCPMGLYLL